MTVHKYKVVLGQSEEAQLKEITRKGVKNARVINRARILLMAHKNGAAKTDKQIREALNIGYHTPYDIRRRYNEGGIQRALYDAARPGKPKTFKGRDEAQICAIACTDAPVGHDRWTLDLLQEEIPKQIGKPIGRTKIWKILLKNEIKPWREKNVVHTEADRRIYRAHDGCIGSIRETI
jgi:putative transposase